MPLYIADQFAELTRFDPAQDRMIPGAGRRIVAVRADSLEDAYRTALRDAQEAERSYLRMSVDFARCLIEDAGAPEPVVDALPTLPQPAFESYRLLGVGNVAQAPGGIVDFDTPGGCRLLRSFPLDDWVEPAGGLPALEVTADGFEDRVPGEAARFVEMRFLDRVKQTYMLQTFCIRTTEREFPACCMDEANRIAGQKSDGQLAFVDVVNYAASRTGWVGDVYELMDEFAFSPAFVAFYQYLHGASAIKI